jgi:hypothetical protein
MPMYYCLRFETAPTWKSRSTHLYPPPPGTWWVIYTPRHWVLFLSPPATRREVEVFETASIRVPTERSNYFSIHNLDTDRKENTDSNTSCIVPWVSLGTGKFLLSRYLTTAHFFSLCTSGFQRVMSQYLPWITAVFRADRGPFPHFTRKTRRILAPAVSLWRSFVLMMLVERESSPGKRTLEQRVNSWEGFCFNPNRFQPAVTCSVSHIVRYILLAGQYCVLLLSEEQFNLLSWWDIREQDVHSQYYI